MNKKDLKHIEKRLLQLRERALKDLGHYDESFSNGKRASDADLSAYSFHMADQGTDAMEREKAFLFASKEGRYLYHLDEALRRLYRTPKQFGVCEDCGDKISFERMDALPHTTLCIRCKEKEETGVSR
ncbi:MAG: TraR/DksA family transcriptional regulator [Gemmatimonadetes bacterium]|nr:TraR/DksA family transcriptional regulator [Gemmatimonadota bacterium]NNK48438.1 TraR/DksA family transcriptional regulator [Gemmatimonadota bacterium]